MSDSTPHGPRVAEHLGALKRRGAKAVMITAYDYPSARIVEAGGVDLVLVGDSAATTVLGYQSTRDVSLAEMLMLCRAVRRGLVATPMIGDLPFGSYEASDALAVDSAFAFLHAGCEAVKLEGAGPMIARVRALRAAGVAVMGHVGLAPQQVATPEGYRARGRDADSAARIVDDAGALEDAGCFAIVVEAVPNAVTAAILERVTVPVIGIGAGPAADGQVLVYHDVLGLIDVRRARFVKTYASLAGPMAAAVRQFASEVRSGVYPAPEHCYAMPDAEERRLAELLGSDRAP